MKLSKKGKIIGIILIILTISIIYGLYQYNQSTQRSRNYYDVLENGDQYIATAQQEVDYYKTRIHELTIEKEQLEKEGKDTSEIEKKIDINKSELQKATERLEEITKVVRQVRDKHAEVTEKKADAERKFDEAVKQRQMSQGKTP
jgi:chromosome segregation ATPase